MPWKVRKGKAYFYRSVRVDGRVRSEYVRGELGPILADLIGIRGRMAAAEKAARLAAAAGPGARDAAVEAACVRVDWLAAAMLRAGGFHRPNRGPWRKRRRGMETATTAAAGIEEATFAVTVPRGLQAAELARFDDLVDRCPQIIGAAQDGDRSALPDLEALFALTAAHGDLPGLIRLCSGDLADVAEKCVIRAAAGKNLAAAEALRHQLRRMRAELAGPDPTPLERLMADRLVLTWADAHAGDLAEFRGGGEAAGKARDRAAKRFNAAVKALAAVRKLALPSIQINRAKYQQVNNPG